MTPPGSTDADWASLLAVADWHRVTGVLARTLDSDQPVPASVRAELAATHLHDTARSLVFDRARAGVSRSLGACGVPAMLLKGAALVEVVYPETSMRDMSDLDVLVPADRVADATAALVQAGYAPLEEPPDGPPSRPARHDAKLVAPDGVVAVELHRHLVDGVDPARFDVAELWSRARPGGSGDHVVPAPHDLLLHVALHFVAGREVRSEGALSQVRDIAWVAERGGVDWSALADVSRRFGVRARVQLALVATRQLGLLRAPAAPMRLDELDPGRVREFLSTRVLTDRARPPFGAWSADRAGLREALWWSRKHLGDTPAGELPDTVPDQVGRVIDRSPALRHLARELVRAPRMSARDLRAGRWLGSLDG